MDAAIHIAPAALPAALRQSVGRLDILGAAMTAGATLCRTESGFSLRGPDGAELARAARLDDLVLVLGARIERLPARPRTTIRLSPALLRQIVSVMWHLEGLGDFLRVGALAEVERRRRLIEAEEIGHA